MTAWPSFSYTGSPLWDDNRSTWLHTCSGAGGSTNSSQADVHCVEALDGNGHTCAEYITNGALPWTLHYVDYNCSVICAYVRASTIMYTSVNRLAVIVHVCHRRIIWIAY